MIVRGAVVSTLLAVLWLCLAHGSSAHNRDPHTDNSASSPLYQRGTELYAKGDLIAAQAVFMSLLRQDPENHSAQIALKRIAMELQPGQASRPQLDEPSWLAAASGAIDEFLLEAVPRVMNFDATLGDALSRVGTLEAHRGRAAQLLAERRRALRRGRKFAKDKELRALVRRMPYEGLDGGFSGLVRS